MMFHEVRFYDNYTDHVAAGSWLYALLGASLIVLALLIFAFPALLAYLIASFLLFDGIIFMVIGWRLHSLRRLYSRWRDEMGAPAER